MGRSSGDGPPESRATFLSTVMRAYGCGKLSTAPGRAWWGRPTCRARQGETAGRGTATEGMRDRMAREREPLSRQRVLRCAVEIADAEGLGGLGGDDGTRLRPARHLRPRVRRTGGGAALRG